VFPQLSLAKIRQVRPRDYAIRFAMGAAISIGAALIGKVAGHRFGGTFLAFPAILPASLTLIQEEEGTARAGRDALGAVLGGAALVGFAMVGEAAFGTLEPFAAIALATAAWLAAAFTLYAALAWLRPGLCDRTRD
jgi:hypothetical protein